MKSLSVILFALAFAAPALAKEGGDPFAACHKDMERLCGDVRPGEGRIIKCMEEKKNNLSSECAAVMARKQQGQQGKPPKH